jgi:hypothetical protein
MAITVKHTKVSTIPDDADTSLVRPSDWNADHTLTGLGTMAEQNANAVAITGGTITGVTGLVTSVTGTAPVVSSGGNTPAISMPAATGSVNGYLTSADWTTFNGKGSGTVTSIIAGTGLSGGTITSTGTIAIDSTVATLSGTQTFTNKRVTSRIGSNGATTSGNITPTSDTADQFNITGLTGTSAIQIPSGTPTDAQRLSIRIKDNGTARTLSWVTTAGGYRVIGTTLPLTTTANKTIYVGCVYNSADSFWDVVAVASEV